MGQVKNYIATFATEDNHLFFTVDFQKSKQRKKSTLYLKVDAVEEKQLWMGAIKACLLPFDATATKSLSDFEPPAAGSDRLKSFASAPSLSTNLKEELKSKVPPLWDHTGVTMQGIMAKLPMSVDVAAAKIKKEESVKGMSTCTSGAKSEGAIKSQKTSKGNNKDWQRRFFQLRDGVLSYYDCTEMAIGLEGTVPADTDEDKGVEITQCKVLKGDVKSMWSHLEEDKKAKKAAKKQLKADKAAAKGKKNALGSKRKSLDSVATTKQFEKYQFSLSRPPLNLNVGCGNEGEFSEWVNALSRTSLMTVDDSSNKTDTRSY